MDGDREMTSNWATIDINTKTLYCKTQQNNIIVSDQTMHEVK